MANTKSALKMIRVARRRQQYNRATRSTVKTRVNLARGLTLGGQRDEATNAARQAIEALDRAAQKGIIHKNNAARHKSRLMKKLNQLSS